MQFDKSNPNSESTHKSKSHSTRSSVKFIPNLTQLNEAAKELPDPEIWPENSYQCPVEVNGTQRSLEFIRKPISRGKKQTPRWIYEGKVLIRKRDN